MYRILLLKIANLEVKLIDSFAKNITTSEIAMRKASFETICKTSKKEDLWFYKQIRQMVSHNLNVFGNPNIVKTKGS